MTCFSRRAFFFPANRRCQFLSERFLFGTIRRTSPSSASSICGFLDKGVMEKYLPIIEEKQEALLRVKKEMKQSVTTGATERNWVTLFKQYENIEELNRRVLMALVDRILIYEDHAIEIVFKYKDEYQQTLEYVLGYADELAIAG